MIECWKDTSTTDGKECQTEMDDVHCYKQRRTSSYKCESEQSKEQVDLPRSRVHSSSVAWPGMMEQWVGVLIVLLEERCAR